MATLKKLPIEKRRGIETLAAIGRNKLSRFTDEEFAAAANHPEIQMVWLRNQAITRLPPFVAPVEMNLGGMSKLISLAGIERMVSLRTLRIDSALVGEPRTFTHLAELPELVELTIHTDGVTQLPRTIATLPSLIKITLVCAKGFDLEHACALLAKITSIRAATFERLEGAIPAAIGTLTGLQRLEVAERTATSLPSTIGALKQLTSLKLEGNKIKALPDELWSCTALEHLGLRYNPLKLLSPKIGQLTSLRVLDLLGTYIHELPEELGEHATLRDLRLPKGIKHIPPGVYALKLDHVIGPTAEKFTLREVETPEDSEMRYEDPSRLPASFGAVRSLALAWDVKTPAITQLARCSELRKLELAVTDLSTVVPHLPPQLVELHITGRGHTVDHLPPLLDLEVLEVSAGTYGSLACGYPKLRQLFLYGNGTPTELEQTVLERLFLVDASMPDVGSLAKLPLTSISLRRVKHLDLAALCVALAGKHLDRLDLWNSKVRTLPRAIARVAIKELDLSDNPIKTLPVVVGAIDGLERILLPLIDLDKSILPGRWKTTKRGGQMTLTRTD